MCKLLSIFAIILAVTCFQANGQIWTDGRCRSLPILVPFEQTRFLGLWYEHSRYDNHYQFGAECGQSQYTAIEDRSDYITVNNSMLFLGNLTWHSRMAFGRIPNPVFGLISVNFNVSLPEGHVAPPPATLQIVQTDYETYAIVWSCSTPPQLPVQSVEYLWILTREPEPTVTTNYVLTQLIRLLFREAGLRRTNQHPLLCGGSQILNAGIFLVFVMSTILYNL